MQALAAVVLGAVVALVVSRLALGAWPSIGTAIEGASDSPPFPAFRVAETSAVILVAAPHLIRPFRTAGHWILFLGVVGGMLIAGATPGGTIAGFLVALTAAAAVRLAHGTSAGRPGLAEVTAALDESGVDAERLELAKHQTAGIVLFEGSDVGGRPLLVKVYGRDAYDNQLLAKLWRHDLVPGPRPGARAEPAAGGRARGVRDAAREQSRRADAARSSPRERRSTTTRCSCCAGTRARSARTGARTGSTTSCSRQRGARSRGSARQTSRTRRSTPRPSRSPTARSGLLDFGSATAAPSHDQLETDRAQLLAATAAAAGADRAIAAAVEALGTDGVAALLPYLQSAALGPRCARP